MTPAKRITAMPTQAQQNRVTTRLYWPAVGVLTIGIGGLGLTGCQVDVGGQTLPSAYYLQDDIQYFPAGPEFKLSKEAAAQKAYKKEIGADGCGESCGGCSSCGH
jgi:hypothetical protein